MSYPGNLIENNIEIELLTTEGKEIHLHGVEALE